MTPDYARFSDIERWNFVQGAIPDWAMALPWSVFPMCPFSVQPSILCFLVYSCHCCFLLPVQKLSKDRQTAGFLSSSGTCFPHSKVSRCPIVRLASVGTARIRAPSLWDGVLNQQNDQYRGCTSKAKGFRPEASSCCSEDVIPVPSGPPPAEPYYLIVNDW